MSVKLIFFLTAGLPRFSKDLISKRWLQSYNTGSEIQESNAPDNDGASGSAPGKLVVVKVPPKIKPKGKNEKFKSGLQLGGELAELLSICGTMQFEKRVSFLKEIIASWKNGQELCLYSKGTVSYFHHRVKSDKIPCFFNFVIL